MNRPPTPLIRDLAAVCLTTLFAAGGAFFLGVLVPREPARPATPASHAPAPKAPPGVYTV